MTDQFQKTVEYFMPLIQSELDRQKCRQIRLRSIEDVEAIKHILRFTRIYAIIKKLAEIYDLADDVWQVVFVHTLVTHQSSQQNRCAQPHTTSKEALSLRCPGCCS